MKAPIIFITDRPERVTALRRSALAGRPVHLWMRGDAAVPRWAKRLRGDPDAAATYAGIQAHELLAIVDLADEQVERRTARTIAKHVRGAEVVVLARERGRRRGSTRGGITWIDEGELLADAIDGVLRRAQARKRLRALRRALGDAPRLAFLVQNDPDPDAIAASLALRAALGYSAEDAPILSCGRVTRPENRRLIDALGIDIRHVARERLHRHRPLVLVDVQPPYFDDALPEVAAVIDHHPLAGRYRARHRDVRTSYGASATMAAEYLFAEGDERLDEGLATALLYGIITDTRSLSRHTSEPDLQMFATLFARSDHALLRRIQHPTYQPLALRRLGEALQAATVSRGLVYLHLGTLAASQEHVVAQFAEFALGIAGAEVSVVSGVFGARFVMSARALSGESKLGERLRDAFGPYGSAGGHDIMAKAVVRLAAWRTDHPYRDEAQLVQQMGAALRRALTRR